MKKFFIATAILSAMSAVAQAQTYSCEPVDMGLSVQWASCNIGASDVAASGDFFAWGTVNNANNTPEVSTASSYGMKTATQPVTGLLPDANDPTSPYDIATYLLGEGWHTPTKSEWSELFNNSSKSSVTLEDGKTKVLRLTSNINGNHIDLCPSGYYNETTLSSSDYVCLHISDQVSGNGIQSYVRLSSNSSSLATAVRYLYNQMPVRAVYRDPGANVLVESITVNPEHTVPAGSVINVSATVMPMNASNTALEWSSSDKTVATVDNNGNVTGVKEGECTITIAATDDSGVSAQCVVTVCRSLNNGDLVDMGTGIMWASKNLGAGSASAIGNYYRYGETEPMLTTDYQFATKESLEGVQIKGNPLYDAATAALGEYYTTPSKQEFEELIANSNILLTTIDGAKGALYTSKTTGNTLFFPASGFKDSNTPAVGYNYGFAYSRTSDYNAQSQLSETKSYVFKDNKISEEDAEYCMPVRPVYKEPVKVTAITLQETQLTLIPGEEYTVAATVSPEDATEKGLEWESSDDAIATVDADGKITAVKDGSCIITVSATDGSGVTARVNVTVASPQYVDLGLSVMWGTANLGAKTEYDRGGYYRLGDLTSLSEADYPFNQYVDIEGKTITGNPEYDAVTAKLGENWCTPTREMFQELIDNSKITQGHSTKYNIGFFRFTSKINGKSIVIPFSGYYKSLPNEYPSLSGELYSLSSTFVPATNVNDPVKVYYLNNKTLRNGSASNSWCPIRPVYREPVKVTAITLQETQLTLAPGDEYTVAATVSPEDATEKGLEWESSDDAIATVDADGKITAVKDGSCVITVSATDGSGVTAQIEVTVESPQYVDLGLSVMWGIANLDAETEYGIGGYYRLGDLTSLSDADYPFNQYMDIDGKTITGNPEYDAAAAKKGDKWCTPTLEMFQELIDNCEITQDWSSENNIGYIRFTSKINGKSIVIPCSGYYSRVSSRFPTLADELYSLTSTFVPGTNVEDQVKVYHLNNKNLKDRTASNFWCPIRPVYKMHDVVEAESLEFDKGHYDVKVGEEFDIIYTLLPENVTNKKLTWKTTEQNKCCTVDENGHVTAVGVGTCEITATTANGLNASCSVTVTAEPKDVAYVDMGTSVMWAESNLGASTPSETGDYYALCNIIKESKTNSWNLFGPNMVDNVVIANDPRYDAATANLGLAWHIPTAEEMQELIDNCTITTYALDGVMGKLFTSKTTGNTLFFPQSGRKYYLSKNPINEEDVMSMTSSWEGQLNLILLDNEVTSQSGDDSPLKRTEYCYTVRPVRAEAVEAERIEISASPKESSSDSYWLSATVYPENASCRNVTWTSSDPEAVIVEELDQPTLRDGSAMVHPRAEGTGPWEVVAHAVDGSGITGVYIINRGSASIEVVEIDLNMEYDVYDLLGRRVLVGALYTDLRQQLKPGFYILAGGDESRIKIKI